MFFSSFRQLDLLIHRIGLITLYAALFFSLYSALRYTLAMFRPRVSKKPEIKEEVPQETPSQRTQPG
jgi:hypothetical protein